MLTSPGQPTPGSHTGPPHPPLTNQPGDDPWNDDTWNMALPGEQAALETLQWHWGEAYHIGVDDGQWWYRRKDGKGGTETASTPDNLHHQIVTDYTFHPVNRAMLPPTPEQPEPGELTTNASNAKAIQWT